MSRVRLQSRDSQPFVRLGTIRDMTSVARKMAMMRAAVQEINRIEGELLKNPTRQEFRQLLEDMVQAAQNARQWTEEVIEILKKITRNVEGYMRDLKNAVD